MIALSVNLNKMALLRNSRDGDRPSVVDAAHQAIAQGALGITVHPRPDQRHIRPDDVYALAELLTEDYPTSNSTLRAIHLPVPPLPATRDFAT